MRIAVLDLYNNAPNQGMKGIHTILENFNQAHGQFKNGYDVFDVRSKNQIPGLDYDAYISTGGPGNPHYKKETSPSTWGDNWAKWMDSILDYNQKINTPKKSVFLICHSFQMMCIHTGAAQVELRKSPSFGIFPMHKTPHGGKEILFSSLSDPFYAVDSRHYQVLDPNHSKMEAMDMKILAYEKIRPHVPFDRAIMAIRFTEEIIGTQFHPEANPVLMKALFKTPEKRESVIEEHGLEKYLDMVTSLDHPELLSQTFLKIIPAFLEKALEIHNPLLLS